MARITKRFVDALGEEEAGRIHRDDDLHGFAVRRNADGSRTYLVEYRAGRGRSYPTRRISLGRHGALTPEDARRSAKQILARVASGEDPAAERAHHRREPTVRDALITALEQHWRPKRRASTAKVFEEMINRTLIPQFGATRLSDLTRSEIRRWHAQQCRRPRAANHELAVLRKALSLAVSDELISDNPGRGIPLHHEEARDRVPTDAELRAVWNELSAPEMRLEASTLIKLLILTGCRVGEWQNARWSDVDLRAGLLSLRPLTTKAGARHVHLSRPAVDLLTPLPRRSDFILCNDVGNGPITKDIIRRTWERVRERAGAPDLRLHDLRHGFATRGAALGANALILRDALGHKTLAMTGRYVSRQDAPVRLLSEKIADDLVGLFEADSGADPASSPS
ncbi:tyrosine-type recombinase/integrase [Methylobacterium segetis]|uniref:tyrosine-type recombinase/integrase n=1 Tax=Methylobacterium segetis TaxID=2488750 RepID=UPI001404C82C|nr:site-specific integrase [Methylobacterium segetis]